MSAAVDEAVPPELPDRSITGEGTTAQQWDSWPRWSELPVLDAAELVPPGCRLVIVAPHPDDETLASGGLITETAAIGRQQLVIGLTDGESSHPRSRRWPRALLARQRRQERFDALAELGATDCRIQTLGIPDGQVVLALHELVTALTELLTATDVVVSPWRFDGHPDHEAAAAAVATASVCAGAKHLEAPIWGWHWAAPEEPLLPWSRAVLLPLDRRAAERKHAAVHRFVSQLESDPSTGRPPILPTWALSRLVREREVFFR